jgi:hypothetical protein
VPDLVCIQESWLGTKIGLNATHEEYCTDPEHGRGVITALNKKILHEVMLVSRNVHVLKIYGDKGFHYVFNVYIPPDKAQRDPVLRLIWQHFWTLQKFEEIVPFTIIGDFNQGGLKILRTAGYPISSEFLFGRTDNSALIEGVLNSKMSRF